MDTSGQDIRYMNRIFDFLKDHGFGIMMIGFAMTAVGLLVFIRTRFMGNATPRIAFSVAIAGLVIYLAGRILVAVQRKSHKSVRDDV